MPTISPGSKSDRTQILTTAAGLTSQNGLRSVFSNTSTLTGGTAYGMLIGLRAGDLITNVVVSCSTAGSGTTLFKAGVYSPDAVTRYAVTADQSSQFGTVGAKQLPLAAAWTAPADGGYLVIVVSTASTTVPTLLRGSGQPISGLTPLEYCTAGTGLSDLPAAGATLSATNALGLWVAVN